jgi:hypothetical protein
MTLRPLLLAPLVGALLAVAACHSDSPEKSATASAEHAATSADHAASDAARAGADAAAASEAALQAGTQAAEAAGTPEAAPEPAAH